MLMLAKKKAVKKAVAFCFCWLHPGDCPGFLLVHAPCATTALRWGRVSVTTTSAKQWLDPSARPTLWAQVVVVEWSFRIFSSERN